MDRNARIAAAEQSVNNAFEEVEEIESFANEPLISGEGRVCDLHTYDARTNSKGHIVYLQTGWQYQDEPEADKTHHIALVLTRFWEGKELERTELQVRSPYIKRAMREVIKSYPGVNING